jgi:ribosomal protein S27AE
MNNENQLVSKNEGTNQEKEFFLLRLERWRWSKSEDISKGRKIEFYDSSPGGVLLDTKAECPLCEGEMIVTAGNDTSNNISARWCCCGACGVTGDVAAVFGEGEVEHNKEIDMWLILPACVVVELEV